MKRILWTLLLFVISTTYIYAQECNLQGIVQYKRNDYVGYVTDVGATIGFIQVKNDTTINFPLWEEYQRIAPKYAAYLRHSGSDNVIKYHMENADEYFMSISGLSADEKKYLKDTLDEKCFSNRVSIFEMEYDYVVLIDESGKYNLNIPYGEYYMVAESENRKRATITELMGRIIIQKVTINKPTKILSIKFDY